MRWIAPYLALFWLAACAERPVVRPAPPPPPRATAAPIDDAPEIESEGEQTITVLERPDHPAVRPKSAAAKPVLTDEACRASPECASEGRCHVRDDSCVALSYADCAAVAACEGRRCKLEGDRCLTVASCRESHDCAVLGLCSDDPAGCTAGGDGDCEASLACKERGACARGDTGSCVATHRNHCRTSGMCAAEGACVPVAGVCSASSDSFCKQSRACREGARCLARNGTCVASCADSSLCRELGLCQEVADGRTLRCAAGSDADCEASDGCRDHGACSRTLQGICRAADDVECRRSAACSEHGRCTFDRGRCLAGSEAECQAATVGCKQLGRCRYEQARGCVR